MSGQLDIFQDSGREAHDLRAASPVEVSTPETVPQRPPASTRPEHRYSQIKELPGTTFEDIFRRAAA